METYPQLLKNVRVKNKKEAREDMAVQQAVKAAEELLGSEGRVLLRESGTEPVLRVMAEAKSEELCVQAVDGIIEALIAAGHISDVAK